MNGEKCKTCGIDMSWGQSTGWVCVVCPFPPPVSIPTPALPDPSPEARKLMNELMDSVESLTKKEMGPPEDFKPGEEYQKNPDSREHKARFYAAKAALLAEFSRLQAREKDLESELEELETAGGDLQNRVDALNAFIAGAPMTYIRVKVREGFAEAGKRGVVFAMPKALDGTATVLMDGEPAPDLWAWRVLEILGPGKPKKVQALSAPSTQGANHENPWGRDTSHETR